jgi:predicted O-linked N-acetylglucosamine transferase (SPINDLY family)
MALSQVSALIDKADTLRSSGNYIQAIQYYDKALAIDPNNVAVLINKGYSLNSLGDHIQAIQYFDRALTLNPNNFNKVAALVDKGAALNGLGKYTQAITYIDQALAIDPNNVVALTNRGHVLDLLGKQQQQQQTPNQQTPSSVTAIAATKPKAGCGPGPDNSTCSTTAASQQTKTGTVYVHVNGGSKTAKDFRFSTTANPSIFYGSESGTTITFSGDPKEQFNLSYPAYTVDWGYPNPSWGSDCPMTPQGGRKFHQPLLVM